MPTWKLKLFKQNYLKRYFLLSIRILDLTFNENVSARETQEEFKKIYANEKGITFENLVYPQNREWLPAALGTVGFIEGVTSVPLSTFTIVIGYEVSPFMVFLHLLLLIVYCY